jgi:hypothetical protein
VRMANPPIAYEPSDSIVAGGAPATVGNATRQRLFAMVSFRLVRGSAATAVEPRSDIN